MGKVKKLKTVHKNMISRCHKDGDSYYFMYGGRGIKVCNEWLLSFDSFYNWAINNGYEETLQIDRIDTNKGYYPENCRWVTAKENSNNTRKNLMIDYLGKEQSLTLWCEELNLHYPTIHSRIKKYNWDPIKALTKPIRELIA